MTAKRKGIEPFIAAILLVLVCVGVGAMLYGFFTGLLPGMAQYSGISVTGSATPNTKMVAMTIKNTGSRNVTLTSIDIQTMGGSSVLSAALTPAAPNNNLGPGVSRGYYLDASTTPSVSSLFGPATTYMIKVSYATADGNTYYASQKITTS